MELLEKHKIMYEHLLTDDTFNVLQNELKLLKIEPLKIYTDLISCLTEEEFTGINEKNIFLNAFFSPASNSILKVSIPVRAKVITFDYNQLSKCPKEERLAIILHEYGHAFNPTIKGDEGEFVADKFAITHGYGNALKLSLQSNIIENPIEFDKEITRQRIARIN